MCGARLFFVLGSGKGARCLTEGCPGGGSWPPSPRMQRVLWWMLALVVAVALEAAVALKVEWIRLLLNKAIGIYD